MIPITEAFNKEYEGKYELVYRNWLTLILQQ